MIRAIVFDLDNTLTDFMRMKEESVTAAIDAMIDAGLLITKEEARKHIDSIYHEKGIEYQNVFDEFLERATGQIDYKILSAGIVAYRRVKEAVLVTYPHTQMTLVNLLKQGVRLAVVSDAPRREAWLRLCSLQLQHIFDHVITYEDTGKRKPDPAPFKKALEMLNVKPAEALMVGDWAERDIVGAKQIGMKTAFARFGDTFDTQHHGADYELRDMRDILDILQKENRS